MMDTVRLVTETVKSAKSDEDVNPVNIEKRSPDFIVILTYN